MTTLSQDTIRKAVEIAPGWKMLGDCVDPPWKNDRGPVMSIHNPSTLILDALAAALVRVVLHAGCQWKWESGVPPLGSPVTIEIWSDDGSHFEYGGIDRDSQDTINAIVEFSEKHPEALQD